MLKVLHFIAIFLKHILGGGGRNVVCGPVTNTTRITGRQRSQVAAVPNAGFARPSDGKVELWEVKV